MAIVPKDRLNALLKSNTLNGIDFVRVVDATQTTLEVHFLNSVAVAGTVISAYISGGESIPTVRVLPFSGSSYSIQDGIPVLTLQVVHPGDFSDYTLSLKSPVLDQFYDHVIFSFKAGCPTDLDCAVPCEPCPPLSQDTPPIDYTAKDFLSFRKALSDFSSLRYPDWQERSEADFGVMFMEALCALGDDLSYTQDRISWEAYWETSTQRRSLIRHARMVDYEPRPATCARTMLQFDVTTGPIPSGIIVSAQAPDGSSVDFETGTGLNDTNSFAVSPRWNSGQMNPYFWDDSQECLSAGSTEAWLVGHDLGLSPLQSLLINTRAPYPADPPIREIVRLTFAEETVDPLFNDPADGLPYNLTHIIWRKVDALVHDHDLTRTVIAGNLVPATQARRYTESFAIDTPPNTARQMPIAIARIGANHNRGDSPYQYKDGKFVAGLTCDAQPTNAEYEYRLPLSHAPLAWLAPLDSAAGMPLPEIDVVQEDVSPSLRWTYRRSLLNAERFEAAYTIDPMKWSRSGVQTLDGRNILDYDSDQGDSVRFGDGVFGNSPESGAYYRVTYRVGGGSRGNVGADSITKIDPQTPSAFASSIQSVTNPFPSAGGADEESAETVRRLAPQAFRAKQFRAVRPEDYQNAAQTLPWVEKAGTRFRWTGSWLTVFTTADPKGTETLPVEEHTELIDLLNRYRLTGYESYVPVPHFVSLDLQITVCARADAFRGDVEADVLRRLGTKTFIDGSVGFFQVDQFTFGTPLERSALEAAIQDAYGVSGVVSILYRRRGFTPGYEDLLPSISISRDEILRVDNDPNRPESGSIKVYVEGGK